MSNETILFSDSASGIVLYSDGTTNITKNNIYELKEFLLDRLGSFDKGFCTLSKEYKEAQSDLIYEILEMIKTN